MMTSESVEAAVARLRPLLQTEGCDISLDQCVREFEAGLITWALRVSNGNKSRAAALLQVKRSTFGDRIARCGLERAATGETL